MAELSANFIILHFFLQNKIKAYVRFVIGFCIYLYLTSGGESIIKELVLDKLRVVTKATTALLQVNWKLEAKLFDILAGFTIDLKHISRSAFFQENVNLLA